LVGDRKKEKREGRNEKKARRGKGWYACVIISPRLQLCFIDSVLELRN
jgi:hypothetical protein